MAEDQLKNANIVIIGGSSGIGLATAQKCVSLGAKVTIASRSEKNLRQAKSSFSEHVNTVVADLTNQSSVEELFDQVGSVDHIFITAGMPAAGSIIDSDIEYLKSGLAPYVWGPIYVAKTAIPKMNDNSSITLISGLYSSKPQTYAPISSVALAATEMLVKVLALELAPIRINAVAPGLIDTPLTQGNWKDEYGATLPVKRIGQVGEVAQAAVFLMTNGFMTGEILHIDGGGRYV